MSDKHLKKYVNREQIKDIYDRKTIQDKYKRYNNILMFISIFISIAVIVIFMLLFDNQVLKSQDNNTNTHFTKRTALVSAELANLYMCQESDFKDVGLFREMDDRLKASGILIVFLNEQSSVVYSSEAIDQEKFQNNMKFSLELMKDKYIVERHKITDTGYIMYFFVPKSDITVIKKNFLTFIVAIFIISVLFREGFSRSIMKKVYQNMVEPLEKIKRGTTEIRNGNLDYEIKVSDCYNRDLKDTFSEFEKMRLKLKENKHLEQQYENNRKELISNISHDLKTPISSILGYVEGIMDGVANTPAKRDRYMQIIYKKSLDMNRLVNDLLLFSKLDVNKVSFRFQKTKFINYMEILFEEYGIELRENGIELVSRYDADESIEIDIDRKQLRRVFNNIIGNAMKHLDKEIKAIEMIVYEDNSEIIIRISDNGKGIDPDKLENIFDRFYKADDSRNTEVGSSGLGLSISKQIVQAHGGRIWATSVVKEGTIIYFTISKDNREGYYAKNTNN